VGRDARQGDDLMPTLDDWLAGIGLVGIFALLMFAPLVLP
jgi:hypothetical protein